MTPFQKRLSCEQQVRVSVSEYPDDDLCFVEKSPEIDSPGESLMTPGLMMRSRDGAVTPTPGSGPRTPRLSRAASFQEEFQRSEERGFQEAAEKVMMKPDLHSTGTSPGLWNLDLFYGLGLTQGGPYKILETAQVLGLPWDSDFGLGLVNT